MIDWSKYPSFQITEFVCRCGCGRGEMRTEREELAAVGRAVVCARSVRRVGVQRPPEVCSG